MRKKYYYLFYIIYLLLYFQVILIFLNPSYQLLVDFNYYYLASLRFWNLQPLYQQGFVYTTSFFIFTPLLFNLQIYVVFLVGSLIICLFLLFKLEKKYWIMLFFILLPILNLWSGNFDPFIFLVLLLCIYTKKHQNLIPILLALISFKLNVVFIIPYFLYSSKNPWKFLSYYLLSILLLNFYMIINYGLIFDFISYIFLEWQASHPLDIIRPYWIYYIYYYWIKSEYERSKETGIFIEE